MRLATWQKRTALGFALSLLWAVPTPALVPDSVSYVQGWPTRPPLLPGLLVGLQYLAGANASLHLAVIIQTAFALLSCGILAGNLRRALSLERVAQAVVFAALILPQLKAARTIASESLAYSFLCLFLAGVLDALGGKLDNKRAALLLSCACGAYLTRAQFVYLLPIVLALILIELVKRRGLGRLSLLRTTGAILAAATIFYTSYFYARFDRLTGVSVAGVQLLTAVVHVATPDDVRHAAVGSDQAFLEHFYASLQERRLLASQRPSTDGAIASAFFGERYNKILTVMASDFRTIKLGGAAPDPQGFLWGMTPAQLGELDHTTKHVANALLRSNWRRYLVLCLVSIWEWHRNFLIAVIFATAVGIGSFWRRAPGLASPLLSLCGMAWLLNVCVVALVEPPQYRYTFYFDSTFLAVLLAVLANGVIAPQRDQRQARQDGLR